MRGVKLSDKQRARLIAKRQAPARPVTVGRVVPGHNCYVPPGAEWEQAIRESLRSWWLNGQCVSAQQRSGGVVRCLTKFPAELWQCPASVRDQESGEIIPHAYGDTPGADRFMSFLTECAELGAHAPSSCPDVFHRIFPQQRLTYGNIRLFEGRTRGGWEEAILTGNLPGVWHLYDIRKAYLWASVLGLPRLASIRRSRAPSSLPGLYAVDLQEPQPEAPYPYNVSTRVIAEARDIDEFGLRIERIIGGVTWSDVEPEDVITSRLTGLSFAKHIQSQYWGRWLSSAPLECRQGSRVWRVRNPVYNPIWASLIIGRVRRRVWEVRQTAAHVFCDSVLTQQHLPTGANVGDWRHEKTYANGITVRGAGHYGPLGALPDKHAGISPARIREVLRGLA